MSGELWQNRGWMQMNKRKQKQTISKWVLWPAVVFLMAVGANFAYQNWRPPQTRVLGLSTKLDKEEILRLINWERAQKGLGAVSTNEQLNAAAQNKGENMFASNYWAHVAPDGTQPWNFITNAGYQYESAGENLGRDFADEESLVAAWMASPTHKANILNGNFSETGIEILDGEIDGEPVLLIVNLFAQPKLNDEVHREVAIYNRSENELVLAGEVMPEGSLTAGKVWTVSTEQVVFALLAIMIVIFLIFNLRYPVGGRRKKNK